MVDEQAEQIEYEDELRLRRLKEQQDKKDYCYTNNNIRETCPDCTAFINSHGHCPQCDY